MDILELNNKELNDEAYERHAQCHHMRYMNKRECNISIDVAEPDGYFHHGWEDLITSGTAYLYITPEKNYAEQISAHLKDVHDNLGFKRVYFDKIAAYEPFITTCFENEMGEISYNWDTVDQIYDKTLSIGVEPYVMIAAIPKVIASDPDNKGFDGGNSSAPKDYELWKNFVKSFTLHLLKRYGQERVENWYFQILNEPELGNLYWCGTHEEWFKCYDYAATGIKEIDPKIKVGPGGFANTHGHIIAAFLDHITTCNYDPNGDATGAPIDFISSHAYPLTTYYDSETIPCEPVPGYNVPIDMSISNDFEKLNRYLISRFGPKHKIETHINEWNIDADPNRLLRDSAANAAFIVRQICECSCGVFNDPSKNNFLGFWCHSDVYDELGEPEAEFCGLFGLLTRNGIRKANYNAFKALHMLGTSRILIKAEGTTLNGIATYNHDKVSILLYNSLYDRDKENGDSKFDRIINFSVNNIPWPRVSLKHYRIDEKRSNAFSAWKDMGAPQNCNEEQLEYLREKMDLETIEVLDSVDTIRGKLKSCFEMPMPSVSLIEITPTEKEFVWLEKEQRKILGSVK
jgi:xylan 1,4-beta-xylosidase